MHVKTGVIGYPIKQTKSPIIHHHWMDAYGIDGNYNAIEIAPEDLSDGIKRLINEGYAGVNATIPHKQAVMNLCDEVDKTARAIGAVNTLQFKDDKVVGTNTDAFGFMENLYQSCPDFDVSGKTALVLGAGGAAQAVVYGLMDAGIGQIFISNRTEEKANLLLNSFAPPPASVSSATTPRQGEERFERQRESGGGVIKVVSWHNKNDVITDSDIIINTTSLGMIGYPSLDIDLSTTKPGAVAYDIVYNPLMTDFLKRAEMHGCEIVTGIGMLVHQARPGFKLWHGIMPDVDEALIQKVLA
jgi:shikimate dehydrogenase